MKPTDNNIGTGFLLTMRYMNTVIPLETVREQYLPHLSEQEAMRQAAEQKLPFPVFKTGGKKSKYFVNVVDVGAWIDRTVAEAAHEWQKVNH